MTTKITRNGLDYTITTYPLSQFQATGEGRFTTEASEMGLAPGQWPRFFRVATLGNGRPFICVGIDEGKTEYRQEFGSVRITIFND